MELGDVWSAITPLPTPVLIWKCILKPIWTVLPIFALHAARSSGPKIVWRFIFRGTVLKSQNKTCQVFSDNGLSNGLFKLTAMLVPYKIFWSLTISVKVLFRSSAACFQQNLYKLCCRDPRVLQWPPWPLALFTRPCSSHCSSIYPPPTHLLLSLFSGVFEMWGADEWYYSEHSYWVQG